MASISLSVIRSGLLRFSLPPDTISLMYTLNFDYNVIEKNIFLLLRTSKLFQFEGLYTYRDVHSKGKWLIN